MITRLEAIQSKLTDTPTASLRINAWQIYGESTLVIPADNWQFTRQNLVQLINCSQKFDKMMVLLPSNVGEDLLFLWTCLSVVDLIVVMEDFSEIHPDFTKLKWVDRWSKWTSTP